jgi:hypothetical protein
LFDVRFFDYHWEELPLLAGVEVTTVAASLLVGAFLAAKAMKPTESDVGLDLYRNACCCTVEACCG